MLERGDVMPLAIICVIIGGSFGCDAIMPTSMLADIVSTEEAASNTRLAAFYLAIKNSVSKLTFIAPMGFAFPILELTGFTSGSDNAPKTLFMLILFYALIPIALRLSALILIRGMPITEPLQS